MRTLHYLATGAALVACGTPACAQVATGEPAKKGETRWQTNFLGWTPQAWFEDKVPLTAKLLAAAPNQRPDSLALVLLPDYRIQLPSRKQYIRVYLLNPTAQTAPIERADATVLGLQVALRLDNQWVLPTYPLRTYCGNSFWQDSLAANSACAINLDADNFYTGTVPVEGRILAHVGQTVVKSAIFTVQLTPLQLYYLRHPRVPFPDIN